MCGVIRMTLFLCLCLLPLVSAQVFPSSYIFSNTETVPVNGSSATGCCSSVTDNGDGTSTCTAPTTSVLFDGNTPTLTGLDGDMWASQLLTIHTISETTQRITFIFTDTPGYQRVERIEMVIFNCPEWGVGYQTVQGFDAPSTSAATSLIGVHPSTAITSCDSLVRVCIPASTILPVIALEFILSPDSDWVHLAEVVFYGNGRTCPPDTIATPSPPVTMPPPTPNPVSADISSSSSSETASSDSSSSDSTSEMTLSATSPTGDNTVGIAVGVVVTIIIVLIIIVIIIIVVVIVYLKRNNRKDIFKTFRDSFRRNTGSGTLEKINDMELTDQVYEAVDDDDKKKYGNKGVSTGSPQVKGGGMYEDIDTAAPGRYEKTGETCMGNRGAVRTNSSAERQSPGQGQLYDSLWEGEKKVKQDSPGQEDEPYSQLDGGRAKSASQLPPQRGASISQAKNPMYYGMDSLEANRRQTSPTSELYAQVQPKKRPKPPKPPQPMQGDVYAEIDKPAKKRSKSSVAPEPTQEYAAIDKPTIPKKSPALLRDLDAEPEAKQQSIEREVDDGMMDDVYSEPGIPRRTSKVATLSKSAICEDALKHNSLYASADHGAPEEGDMDNEYAVPGPAPIPEPNPSNNIYEQIYNETLSPSSFEQWSSPDESDNLDDLYPYSSIYTVPVVSTDEKLLEVTKENIEVQRDLGAGNFGRVVLAKTINLSCRDLKISISTDTNVRVLVAVKMLKSDANAKDRSLFEKEYKFMSRLKDRNVIRLIGICVKDTPFIMMEYMEKGDLNQFLQKYEAVVDAQSPRSSEITTRTLIHICTQIASAMKYLASNNFVHRDLATRNCLVGDGFQVKISDFGMSRSLYDSHYYVIKGHAILPIRWMATECFFGKFSAKTDVWAFGATMWEVFELSKHEPYHEMEDRVLVKDACKGDQRTLLSRPVACPEEVYQILLRCWAHEANDRATFEELHEMLLSS